MLFLPAWDIRRDEEFSERDTNSFKLCATHFTGSGRKVFPHSLAHLVTGLSDCEAGYIWSIIGKQG